MNNYNLEVGCGSFKGHTPLLNSSFLHTDIQKTEWNKPFLDVVCDVCHLPFKDKSFENVYASHVLEHLDNPILAIKEMIRVSMKTVVIKVPHILSKVAKQATALPFDTHKNVFRRKWFTKVLKNYRFVCKVNYRPWLIFLNRPYEIEVIIFLN